MTRRLRLAVRLAAAILVTAGSSLPFVVEARESPRGPRHRLSDDGRSSRAAHTVTPLPRLPSIGGTVAAPICWIESNPVAFGSIVPGQPSVADGAVQVRVVSPGPFVLKLEASAPLRTGSGGLVPSERLAWRTGRSVGFVPLTGATAAVVGEGGPPGAAGAVIVLDLRLDLEDSDPLGAYVMPLRVFVEPR